MKIGVGKSIIEITEEDLPLKEYTSKHDEIYVRSIWLNSNEDVLLISIEMTSLFLEAVEHFKEYASSLSKISKSHIYISVSHTFSVPHISPKPKDNMEENVSKKLYCAIDNAIKNSIKEAYKSKVAARLYYSKGDCNININRNVETESGYWLGANPLGYSNHEMRVLAFYDEEDNPLAMILNYDIQASVMDQSKDKDGGKWISGDIAGEFSRKMESNGWLAAIFTPGCAGDQMPEKKAVTKYIDGSVSDIGSEGFKIVKDYGAQMSNAVNAILVNKRELLSNRIEICDATVEFPQQLMQYRTPEIRPHKTYNFEAMDSTAHITIAMIQLGEISILLTQPELNSKYGDRIRAILGEDTLIITLVNGAIKYLPEADDYKKITYTAMNTTIGQGSDELFIDKCKEIGGK